MEKAKKRYNKFLKFIYIVCGAFGFIAYVSYLIKIIIWPEGARGIIIAVAGCLVTLIPVVFRKAFEKHLPHRLFKVLENIFAWGMLFYTVTFLTLVIYILNAGGMQVKADQVPENSAFIVYGAGIRDDRPGNVLKKRLDKTIEYMEASPDSICVVSGAQGPSENYTEAYVMKKYLTENGIDESRVHIDETATSTKENIRAFLALLEASDMEKAQRISVSSDFHMPRIALLWQMADLECAMY